MTERQARGVVTVINTQITAKTKAKFDKTVIEKNRKAWDLLEEILKENLKEKGAPEVTDKAAPTAQLNLEIDANLKMKTKIQALTNNKRLRYEVEDAILKYLNKKE